MPTKNPRLTFTMKPSMKAQLERLSELTGNSQGALVSELLEGSEQVFERIIVVLEAAKVARQNLFSQPVRDASGVGEVRAAPSGAPAAGSTAR